MKEDDFLKEIEKDIEKKCKKIMKEISIETSKEIQEAYINSIQEFYKHKAFYYRRIHGRTNKPRFYKRTYSLFTASSLYGKDNDKYYYTVINENKRTDYTAGIEVSSDNIEGNPYGHKRYNIYDEKYHVYKIGSSPVDKEWVFLRSFEKGIHGFYKGENNDNEKSSIYTNLRNYHQDEGNRTRIPPLIMEISPKEIMDSKFYHITSNRNLATKINEKINKYFGE